MKDDGLLINYRSGNHLQDSAHAIVRADGTVMKLTAQRGLPPITRTIVRKLAYWKFTRKLNGRLQGAMADSIKYRSSKWCLSNYGSPSEAILMTDLHFDGCFALEAGAFIQDGRCVLVIVKIASQNRYRCFAKKSALWFYTRLVVRAIPRFRMFFPAKQFDSHLWQFLHAKLVTQHYQQA